MTAFLDKLDARMLDLQRAHYRLRAIGAAAIHHQDFERIVRHLGEQGGEASAMYCPSFSAGTTIDAHGTDQFANAVLACAASTVEVIDILRPCCRPGAPPRRLARRRRGSCVYRICRRVDHRHGVCVAVRDAGDLRESLSAQRALGDKGRRLGAAGKTLQFMASLPAPQFCFNLPSTRKWQ
jgi:hypothetical protein